MTTQTTSADWTPIGALLLGAAAGGVAAILLAPHSGTETRRRLKDGFLNGKQTVAQRSKELTDAGKKRVTDEAHRIDAALKAGKTAYRQGAAAEA